MLDLSELVRITSLLLVCAIQLGLEGCALTAMGQWYDAMEMTYNGVEGLLPQVAQTGPRRASAWMSEQTTGEHQAEGIDDEFLQRSAAQPCEGTRIDHDLREVDLQGVVAAVDNPPLCGLNCPQHDIALRRSTNVRANIHKIGPRIAPVRECIVKFRGVAVQ